MNIIEILDSSDTRISEFSIQRDHPLKSKGQILVDSEKVVVRMLKLGIPLKTLLATDQFYQKWKEILTPYESANFYKAPHKTLESIIGHRLHQGVIAIGERPKDTPLNQLDDKILIFNGVNNSENIGTILRNCHAFSVGSIIVDNKSCTPWVRRSIRVSMGSIFKSKIYHSSNIGDDIDWLQKNGYKIFTAGISPEASNLKKVTFPKKCCVVMGCEHDGVSEEIAKKSDAIIKIPMARDIDSLNVATATGIILYEMAEDIN